VSSCARASGSDGNSRMAEEYSFTVTLEPQPEGGFTVLVPALPEVVTEGDTEDEAIRLVLAYRRDRGLPIPDDVAPALKRITVAAA
jgi:antitoxin HicB